VFFLDKIFHAKFAKPGFAMNAKNTTSNKSLPFTIFTLRYLGEAFPACPVREKYIGSGLRMDMKVLLGRDNFV
jgi:hypothetical protein